MFSDSAENSYMEKLALSLILLSLWSCAKTGLQSVSTGSSENFIDAINSPFDLPSSEGHTTTFKPEPLAWESKAPGSSDWSQAIYSVIKTEEPQMLGQNVADDVETYCPKYRSLNDNQRLNFWGQLFAGMAKYESGWKPSSRMTETTMGIDPYTGRQVASEGLLQLSYQDETSYNLDCGFDWSRDKYLSDSDPQKTIFSPQNNLRCGIKIMARQLKNKRAIGLTSGVYWSVLKIGGKYTQIPGISAITKSLTFCE